MNPSSPDSYKNLKSLRTPEELFSLKGKVGIIFGGAGKMGQEFTQALSYSGAEVILSDLDAQRCTETASRLDQELPTSITSFPCDVSSSKNVKELFGELKKKYSKLDFLIHNVMSKPQGYYEPFENYSSETWESVLAGNLSGAFYVTQAAAEMMDAGGSIVMTSSIYGKVGPDQGLYNGCSPAGNIYGGTVSLNAPGAYSASKGGVVSYSRYLATLLAPRKIRVNALIPGGVFDGQEEVFHQNYVERTPLARMAEWSDFNGAIVYLVSEASRYMTGAEFVVDGGWTAW